MNVLELFSGIGGFRLALCEALDRCNNSSIEAPPIRLASITAIEMSQTNVDIYRQNFEGVHAPCAYPHLPFTSRALVKDIVGFDAKDFDGKADIWTMSPPCQPFTTMLDAKRNDTKDKRTKPWMHLCKILDEIATKPRYICVENVRGVTNSKAPFVSITRTSAPA